MIPFDPLDPDHHDPPPTRGQALAAGVALIISGLLVAAFLWFAIDRAVSAPPETTTPPSSILPPPTVPEPAVDITTAAVATAPARRVSPPITEPAEPRPLDCAAIVDGLTYRYLDVEPARIAYRTVAACAGGRAPWPADVIARWEAFIVDDVIRGESGGCPNLRGGADLSTTGAGHPCLEIADVGRGDDSGFGQLIAVWWDGPSTPVCAALALCNPRAITASPYWSMRALLVAVEHDGKRPWCYDARSRAWHPTCAITPRRWPA